MEDFKREIAQRVDAAVKEYHRRRGRPERTRQRARQLLVEVRRRFVQAALHSDSCLRVRYINEPGVDRAVGYALVWVKCPPRRELCIRLGEGHRVIEWELASPDLGISRAGRLGALDFRPEFRDELICALLEQESWERSRIPTVGARAKPKVEGELRDQVQERLQEKGAELRGRLHEAVDTFRQNVGDGVQSAVKQGSRRQRQFGRPPSGRAPVGRPPSAPKRMN